MHQLEQKKQLKKLKQLFFHGENKIFVGPIKDQTGTVKVEKGKVMTDAELLQFNWFVKGVEGKIEK